MNIINQMIEAISNSLLRDAGTLGEILAMLCITFVLSAYEFLVYRLVSRRTMYNKSFHISIMIIPFFIGAIVMALQSNIVITLGTIGALAIIRFRTAVKDPIDMIYILWSIFIGITCGCQLYKLCILTTLFVTITLLIINMCGNNLLKNPYVLVINSKNMDEKELEEILNKNCKKYKLKSRNYTSDGVDYIYRIETNDTKLLCDSIQNNNKINRFSILEYENEDVI